MSRPIKSDLDFRGMSRVTNLPAPSAPGDAVPLSHLNQALSGVIAGTAPQTISEDLEITGTCVMFGSVVVTEGTSVTIPENCKWVVYQ